MEFNLLEFINTENLSAISNDLKQIADNGIPIIDTFAPVTTIVNVLTTVFATALGGWVTIQLFKRQEKMRIKEDLRLSFYKVYSQMYNDLYQDILDLNEGIKCKNKYLNKDSMYIQDAITGSHGLKSWNCTYSQETTKADINRIKSIQSKSQNLNKFLKSNTVVFNFNTIYDKVHNKIEEIQKVYITIESTYNITDGNNRKLINALNDIDEQVKILNSEGNYLKFDKDTAKKLLINVEKNLEHLKEKAVKEHNELVPTLLNIDIELDNILNEIEIINKKIQTEYIGEYFK